MLQRKQPVPELKNGAFAMNERTKSSGLKSSVPGLFSWRMLLWSSIVIGLAARVIGAFDDGIFWPDEIYQSFEPAHALVFGYGLLPWEYVEGARTWAMPGLVAVILKVCVLSGLDTPEFYVRVVKIIFAVAGVVAALGVYRLAMAFGASKEGAAASAALWSFASLAVYFGPRAMSENASLVAVVWGLALLFERRSPAPLRVLLASSLLGIAVLLRLQCALFVLGVVPVLAAGRQWRTLWYSLLGLGAWAVIYGALDAVTWHHLPDVKWGGWFHSAFVYLRFNIIENGAEKWGSAPWHFYPYHLFSSMPAVSLVLLFGLAGALWRRAWVLPSLFTIFVVAHMISLHKEIRFIVPALPLAAACAGVALRGVRHRMAPALLVVAFGLISLAQTPFLTMGKLGAYLDRPESSAWGDFAAANRLLMEAGKRDDICGIRVDVVDMAWVGGATYLHREVPLYRPGEPVEGLHFNYILARDGLTQYEKVASKRGVALYRLPWSCVPDHGFPWQLEKPGWRESAQPGMLQVNSTNLCF